MHPSVHARHAPDKPAYVMAGSGTVVSYAQLEERSLRCAQLLRGLGLGVGDTVAICMDNNPRYFELCWAAQRSGLYYTCVSNRLTAAEIAYIVRDSGARALFLSVSQRAVAAELAQALADIERYGNTHLVIRDTTRNHQTTSVRATGRMDRCRRETGSSGSQYTAGVRSQPALL